MPLWNSGACLLFIWDPLPPLYVRIRMIPHSRLWGMDAMLASPVSLLSFVLKPSTYGSVPVEIWHEAEGMMTSSLDETSLCNPVLFQPHNLLKKKVNDNEINRHFYSVCHLWNQPTLSYSIAIAILWGRCHYPHNIDEKPKLEELSELLEPLRLVEE